MNLSIICFLAWRYIIGVQENKRVSTVSTVCFLSIFAGTVCLALQIFVSEGFDRVLSSKMQSIYPELMIEAPLDQSFDYEAMNKKLLSEFKTQIAATAPAHTKRVVLQPIDSKTPSAVVLKAVNPTLEPNVSSLAEKIMDAVPLEKALEPNAIIIGKKIADFYDLKNGDKCKILFTSEDELNMNNGDFESVIVTIGGIMETGIVQYDKYTIISSFETMQSALQEDTISEIGLKLQPKTNDEKISEALKKQFSVETNSWKTLYPALVSATQLEKYVLSLLLFLMTFIASANIISLIFMQITRKKMDIALLKTLGMTDTSLITLFTLMGTFIVGSAAFLGTITAVIIGILLQKYPFIKLPDAYFCTHLPVHIDISTVILIFIIIVILGTISSLFSSRSIRSINITQTLRFQE